ncbi:MAG: isomerizing glutamine--fructose-6-phosphate transaminase, partial [Anaerolineales bacterium]
MCGIVGYVGARDATPIILSGLKRLEYRGYDSAGLAVISDNGKIDLRRDSGKLSRLQSLVREQPLNGHIGIGHTRWATHGEPSQRNAHPHVGAAGDVVLVHNGIVENFLELKDELRAEGVEFKSDTDTEVIVQLVERNLAGGQSLEEAVRRSVGQLMGANAVVVISPREPDKIVAARIGNAGGVAVGVGKDEMFVASDIPAVLDHTREMAFLEPGWMTVVTHNAYQMQTLAGEPLTVGAQNIPWDPVSAEKGAYKHFMQKEIHEQVRSITDTIGGRIDFSSGSVSLPDLNLTPAFAQRIRRIVITACGTAAHAGMVGKILIEALARIPVELSIASEFRYADPIV